MKGFMMNYRSSGEVPKTISQAVPLPEKKNMEDIKRVLFEIKQLHKMERDPENKTLIATAGLALNRILIRR